MSDKRQILGSASGARRQRLEGKGHVAAMT
jgi:hypothetical protein